MPARFKLDENLPRDAEALLREAGHDVHTVLDQQQEGTPILEFVMPLRRRIGSSLLSIWISPTFVSTLPRVTRASGCCAPTTAPRTRLRRRRGDLGQLYHHTRRHSRGLRRAALGYVRLAAR